jgi:hypothetical protein
LSGTYPNPGVAKINGTALSGLATGLLKNTTSTGVPSIAVAGTDYAAPASTVNPNTPAWLQYLGSGADGSNTNASGNMNGDYYYTNFTVPYGNTVSVNYSSGLIVHATGTCTIAGTIEANGATTGSDGVAPTLSSGGGGSGGGTAAGTAGQSYQYTVQGSTLGGGTAGAASGGNGGNGTAATTAAKRTLLAAGWGQDAQFSTGGDGKQGGSSGGAAGNGAAPVVLICAAITGTDGTHTGIIDASGQYGSPASASSTGGGSGGGGGVVLLSSQASVGTWPTVYTAPGPGALGSAVLTTPTLSAITPAAGTGCSANTYYYEVSALEGPIVISTNTISSITGYSTLSSEQTCVTSGSNLKCPLTWTQVPGATGYVYWRGTSTGTETYAGTVSSGSTLTATDACAVSSGGTAASGYATTNTTAWTEVPEALATGGTCTTAPKVLLGVTTGALSSCTVIQAGAGCGTGTGLTWNILGGGGSGGTITPTWSSGALASCSASGGSGYTPANYPNSGSGGDGGDGWSAQFQSW